MQQTSQIRAVNRGMLSIVFSVWVVFFLASCNSTDDIPIQKVDSQERITDALLKKQQQERKLKQPLKNTYFFGFDLRASPQEDAAQYLPFLEYLESSTGFKFKLHFTPKNSSTIEELGKNNIQFAAMGAMGFLKSRTKYNVESLVRGLNIQGKAEYQSMLVVRPGSDIKTITDIKGRTLAFGSSDSTQGHLIPRIMLVENKVNLEELQGYSYTGSHQNCAESVVSGKHDVCGMQDQLAKKLSAQGQVRIIHRSRYFPSSGIVVHKSVPATVIEKVKNAMLAFDPLGKNKKGLYNWDKTEMPNGFVEAKASDYEDLYEWSKKLGFLQTDQHQVKYQ